MRIAAISEAIEEAERFIARANAALVCQVEAQRAFRQSLGYINGRAEPEIWVACGENATCKRASLDLTRALARMRKG